MVYCTLKERSNTWVLLKNLYGVIYELEIEHMGVINEFI